MASAPGCGSSQAIWPRWPRSTADAATRATSARGSTSAWDTADRVDRIEVRWLGGATDTFPGDGVGPASAS